MSSCAFGSSLIKQKKCVLLDSYSTETQSSTNFREGKVKQESWCGYIKNCKHTVFQVE